MLTPARSLALVSLFLVSLTVFACSTKKSAPPGATPTTAPTPADATAIRGVDFASVPAVAALVSQFAGQVDNHAVVYADLTGDGREDAVVPIASGGTMGNVAYVVLMLRNGRAAPILTRTVDKASRSGLQMNVVDGRLVESVGEYGPEDPLCCPSQLRKTYFRWDGANLQVEREETVKNPNQPKQ